MTYCNIQTEKAEAMMRYRRLRNVANVWRIIEVSVALLLFSRWLPAAGKVAAHCLVQVSEYLYNQHVNFVIGNAIIVVIVLISRQSTGGEKSGAVDLVDEYVRSSESQLTIAYAGVPTSEALTILPPAAAAEEEKMSREEKRIVVPENAVAQSGGDSAITALEEAKEQLRRFQRMQSEKLRRDIRVKPRRELLRSETEMKPRAASASATDYSNSWKSAHVEVERLSSDDFRKTIEDFIARQRRSLTEQKIAGDN